MDSIERCSCGFSIGDAARGACTPEEECEDGERGTLSRVLHRQSATHRCYSPTPRKTASNLLTMTSNSRVPLTALPSTHCSALAWPVGCSLAPRLQPGRPRLECGDLFAALSSHSAVRHRSVYTLQPNVKSLWNRVDFLDFFLAVDVGTRSMRRMMCTRTRCRTSTSVRRKSSIGSRRRRRTARRLPPYAFCQRKKRAGTEEAV